MSLYYRKSGALSRPNFKKFWKFFLPLDAGAHEKSPSFREMNRIKFGERSFCFPKSAHNLTGTPGEPPGEGQKFLFLEKQGRTRGLKLCIKETLRQIVTPGKEIVKAQTQAAGPAALGISLKSKGIRGMDTGRNVLCGENWCGREIETVHPGLG